MKQFFKFIFASCLGTILAFVGVALIGGTMAASFGKGDSSIKSNSVLKLNFQKALPELTNNIPSQAFEFDLDDKSVVGLNDLVNLIEKAETDDDIKGIFLQNETLPTGFATANVVRRALNDFKESGKFVISYGNNYSQSGYYLASVADEIYLNPVGSVEFKGFGAVLAYFKDMLDNLGIKMQVYHVGKFKSATEPFRYNKMSDENRLQSRELLNDYFDLFLEEISASREISVAELKNIANEYAIRNADDALERNFITGKKYYDEVLTELRNRIGLDEDEKINFISKEDYYEKKKGDLDISAKDRIAVVYAEGSIVDGKGEKSQIGGDKYAKIFRDLKNNDKVKAVVLRINSGGGSALASEIMWREITELQRAGKPVVVSMGDLAASGGYYIACSADSILAESNTLTGSIGVFGMIPSVEKFMSEKIGITFDTISTSKYGTGITGLKDISDDQGAIIQEGVEEIYETFLQRVAAGRGMTKEAVHEVAQGRVWTGKKGLELGLVDQLGDLNDAIEIAANLANLSSYRTTNYPRMKKPLEEMIETLTGQGDKDAMIKEQLGEYFTWYEQVQEVKQMEGIQARMPYHLQIQW